MEERTIAAIATPPGRGGIGVIRVSGPDSLPKILQVVRSPRFDHRPTAPIKFEPARSILLNIINPVSGLLIDEALVTFFKGPRSFTGEDVVEISSHGSPVVLAEILHVLTGLGIELAEPGEFSRRAFLNGRLDLAQAEAINDLINAQTLYQARIAARQVCGELSRQIQPLRQGLIDLIVHLESVVEFVEDDLDQLNLSNITGSIDRLIVGIERIAGSFRVGRIIRSGVRLALVGRPNVGKSSVFNGLLGVDRAIVTDIPGTTRDVLSDTLSLHGVPLNLVDTAGIRETEDPIERIGVERTRSAVVEADLVMAVIESSSELPAEELEMLQDLPINIYVVNKCDLGPVVMRDEIARLAGRRPVIEVSALTGMGFDQLGETIHRIIVEDGAALDESSIITNERHHRALLETLVHLRRASADLQSGFTEEIALDNLHLALRSLGLISGETLLGDIINQIFSTFCIGK